MEQKERFIKLNNKLFYSFNELFSLSSDLIGNKSYNTFLLKNKFDNIEYYDEEFSVYLNDDGKRKIAENIYQKIIAITT